MNQIAPDNTVPNIAIRLITDDDSVSGDGDTNEDVYPIPTTRSVKFGPDTVSLDPEPPSNLDPYAATKPAGAMGTLLGSTHLMMPGGLDVLEQNRRASIAVLQNKVNQYNNPYARRKTVDVLRSWLAPAETPTNCKIFGGKRAVQEEKTRSLAAGWIIHPYSNLRYHWDLFISVLLAVNMFVLPLNIAFLETTKPWIAFEVSLFIFFSIDILLNFKTGYKEENNGYRIKIVLDPVLILRRYLKTWLALDFISSLPLDLITLGISGESNDVGLGVKGASNALKFLRLTKILSLLKMLRVMRIVRIVGKYEEFYRVTASIGRYIKLVSCMLLVAHWNGCLAFLVPLLQQFPPKCWVSLNRLENSHWSEQYGWALFKALSHMLCIGYGRFIPQLLSEAIITIFSMITGATFYALFIAHSMAYLQQSDSARRQFQEKFKQIEEYMCYRNLPIATRERITDYYEHKYTQKRLFNEDEILSEVSPPLRNDIVNHNCRDLVEKVPFLKEGGNDFISLVINQLGFDVFLPGDTIIKEGTFGNDMYFIRYGMVDVIADETVVTSLSEGEYFGEITMLTGARRVATVKAVTVCNLFILHKDNLFLALDEFPEMRVLLEHIALDRLMKLKVLHPDSLNHDAAATELENNNLERLQECLNESDNSHADLTRTGSRHRKQDFGGIRGNNNAVQPPEFVVHAPPVTPKPPDNTRTQSAATSAEWETQINGGSRPMHRRFRRFSHDPSPNRYSAISMASRVAERRSKSLSVEQHKEGDEDCNCALCNCNTFMT